MKVRLLALVVVALAVGAFLTSPADAAGAPPLGCPGLEEVPGGYLLTRDTACVLDGWVEDNTVVDLGGHTLSGGLRPAGSFQTVRNGTVVMSFDWWVGASAFTVSRVIVRPPSDYSCFFCIEASDVTVEHSVFRDFNGIALSFFYGSGGTIRNSIFVNNRTAISNQQPGDMIVEGSWFIDNGRGVNLWTEEGYGVDFNTITGNLFWGNEQGVRMESDDYQGYRSLSLNELKGNLFVGNDRSGLSILANCYTEPADCRFPIRNAVGGNRFWGNGFGVSALDFDDGATARGYVNDIPILPEALAGYTLTGNRAYFNAGLGLDVSGVVDGGDNRGLLNGERAQCDGLDCRYPWFRLAPDGQGSAGADGSAARVRTDQLSHPAR